MNTVNVSSLPVVRKNEVIKVAKLELFVQQYSLSPVQREDVVFMITEYRTNLPTIERMLGWEITLGQMRELLEAREVLNDGFEETISLIGLHRFAEAFPSITHDSEVLTDKILEIRDVYDPLHKRFIGSILSRLVRARESIPTEDPVHLAEVLATREGVTDASDT